MKLFIFRSFTSLFILSLLVILIVSVLSLYIIDIIIHTMMGIESLILLFLIFNLFKTMRLISKKSVRLSKFRFVFAFNIILMFFISFQSIVTGAIMNTKARNEVKAILNQIDYKTATIKIGDKKIQKVDTFITDLKDLKPIMFRSMGRIINYTDCKIIYDGKSLNLIIAEDTMKKNRYFVNYKRYRYTKHNHIGGFTTDSL